MVVFIYIACGLLLLYYLYTRNNNYWNSKGIPYEKPFLIFGSFYDVFTRKKHFSTKIREIYNKYKDEPYIGIFNFNQPCLFVRSPELLKKILVKDFDKFTDRKVATNEKVDPIAYHNLPSAKGKTWRNLRSKLSPIFTSGKMKLMLPLMKEIAEVLNSHFSKHNGETLEIRLVMKKFAVDIISSCAFGINSNCLKHNNTEILNMATQLLDLKSVFRNFSIMCFFFAPKLVDILRVTFVDKTAANYFMNIFKTTLTTREEKNIVRNDLIDLLSTLKKKESDKDEYKFDDKKMAAQAITFFIAGNDTISLSLSFAFYELALNKDSQNRLREEVLKVYEQHGDFTYEALQQMKYLDMVFKETLRKYPLTSSLDREAGDNYTFEETGFTVEKGLSLHIPVAGLHYDPKYFPNPEKFDPERFSDENKQNIVPYTYLPFGEGPRVCIGERFATLSGKVALAYAIKDFQFETTNTTVIPIRLDPGSLFMTAKDGINLKVTKIM